jgi:phage/plasmid-associated DNA primase
MKDDEVLHDSVLINDLYAAEQFVKLMGDDLVFDNGILYVYHQGIWSENEELLNTCISDLKEKLVFKQMGGISGIKTYDYSGSVKNRENLKKMLPSVLEKKENFLESGRTKSTGKLLFKNGIYDFKTSTLTDFDRSIVFSSMIPFDWNPEVQEEDIEFVTQVFFKDAFKNEEVPALLKHFLMRGMIGDYQMKKFLTCIGPTNCSKGMLQEFMKYIFSGNVGNFNCNSLIARKNTEGTRDLGWFMGLVNTRICFGSEIKSDKDSKIDSEMIKQIVSGGETTTGRRLFKDEQNFISRTMPILLVNEMSTFSSMNDAIKNRLIPIEYDYSFVEFPTKAYQKQSDPQLKNKLKDEKYANAMIHILNREYQKWMTNEYKELPLPESALDFKDDIIPIVDIEEELEDVFEITKNFDDFVEIKEIERELINKGSKIYKNVISTQLQRIGCKANKKYIEKRQVRVILGIKRK